MKRAITVAAICVGALLGAAPPGGTGAPGPSVAAPVAGSPEVGPASPPTNAEIQAAIARGVAFLLEAQEGPDHAEWPYEGVYRVAGQIPVGYRIGGTAIAAEALLRVPGYAADAARQAAVARASAFVCAGTSQPLMNPEYNAGYDVRGWGYCYGARFLLALRAAKAVPAGTDAEVNRALRWYLDAMQKTEIPEVGGWNYAREPGIETPSRAAAFMTGPCLQTLFEARAQGLAVDSAVVTRGLDALQRCRTEDGNFTYATMKQAHDPARSIPGAIGRMVCGEAVLMRADRSDDGHVRRALDAFLDNWGELEKRRQQNGTHVPPYNVAPYYFFFGFMHAADAVELLPEADRAVYRNALVQLLFRVRNDDGTWNDRVFPRSRNFGTAMTVMALARPGLAAPAGWKGTAPGTAPATNSKDHAK